MKQHTHCLLAEWACTAWDMILRTIWLGLAVAATIGVLRLMAWADEGSRNLPVTTPAGVNGSF